MKILSHKGILTVGLGLAVSVEQRKANQTASSEAVPSRFGYEWG